MPAMFQGLARVALAMCAAGIVVFLIGAWRSWSEITEARGLDKIAALSHLCYAIPLGVFGALHLAGPQFVQAIVPPYMPGRMFWVYFVGCALIAAALSIASRIAVRWSGLLAGIMMFLFVAMIHLPGALAQPGRIIWTIVFREMSFGGGGWILAGMAWAGEREGRSKLVTIGCVFVVMALFVFGVLHFIYPLGLPGVPLKKEIPMWVPARPLVDYLTGAALVVSGISVVLNRKARTITTLTGGWLLLMILVIYGPVLIGALANPGVGVEVEGINYFADTLFFTGAVLALARSRQRS